ncbi:uncharacterized protein LOC120351211 [Nilaparvata lugens]|uniref:uncharacterized protein LOC120351211 n=1 Tax=Nilaparvata lugens TaxID=108931 RepID=UPI00193C8A74|nr:uncharacterized protein LOC120351211 [Nilaparvata lugens]
MCSYQILVREERLEEELRDQIIFGIHDKATQNYFLRTKDLTYSMVHDKAFADEQASVGVTLLNQSQGSFNDTQGTVNKIDSMYKNGKFNNTTSTSTSSFQRQNTKITHLKGLGSSSALESTLRVLRKVFTYELANKYSLLGRKKRNFENLAICKIYCFWTGGNEPSIGVEDKEGEI